MEVVEVLWAMLWSSLPSVSLSGCCFIEDDRNCVLSACPTQEPGSKVLVLILFNREEGHSYHRDPCGGPCPYSSKLPLGKMFLAPLGELLSESLT